MLAEFRNMIRAAQGRERKGGWSTQLTLAILPMRTTPRVVRGARDGAATAREGETNAAAPLSDASTAEARSRYRAIFFRLTCVSAGFAVASSSTPFQLY